jgi:hypothetical protein
MPLMLTTLTLADLTARRRQLVIVGSLADHLS